MNDKLFLLSVDEVKQLPLKYLECGEQWRWWWLRSIGESNIEALAVDYDGFIYDPGYDVYLFGGIRPALQLDGSENIESWKGDIVDYLGVQWLDISKYLGKPVLLAKKPLFEGVFDTDSSDYEKSQVRRRLQDWLAGKEK